MIRVTVMYPKQEGGTFDYDYYLQSHVPLMKERLGEAIKQMDMFKGVGSVTGEAEAFVTIAHLWFDSVEDLQNSFGPHSREILADIPNFTNLQPTVQIDQQLRD